MTRTVANLINPEKDILNNICICLVFLIYDIELQNADEVSFTEDFLREKVYIATHPCAHSVMCA